MSTEIISAKKFLEMTGNKPHKRLKYGNKFTVYHGVKYQSAKEADMARNLDLQMLAKEVIRWERQVKFSVDISGKHICNYFLDFRVHYANGEIRHYDVKGGKATKTAYFQLKKKLVGAVHGIEIICK